MKKTLLILFLFASAGVFSQGVSVNHGKLNTVIPIYQLDGDSAMYIHITNDYNFSSQILWYNLDQLDGSVKYKYSMFNQSLRDTPPHDSTFVDYPMKTLLLNVAAGTSMMQDMDGGFGTYWLGFYIDSGTATAGSVVWNINLIKKP